MNVLSLFDGMSCGHIALDRLGIKVDNYYAAEIDKYAIEIAKKNYPDTIHLGDVTKIEGKDLPKIDLLLGGSPCQGFSFAGKRLNLDDPRSALFFEFVRLLKECSPKYFFLENVKMKQEFEDIISHELGVKPIFINSSLVSAQSRERLYWTNIRVMSVPDNKHIVLKDILEDDIDHNFKQFKIKTYFEYQKHKLSYSPDGLCHVGEADINGNESLKRVYDSSGKSPTINTMQGGNTETFVAINEHKYRKLTVTECERLQTVSDGYTEGVSKTQRGKMLGNGWTVDVIVHLLKNLKEELK